MLLQGVGGGFGIKAVEEQGSPFGSDSGSDSGFGSSDAAMGSATLSLVPLTVTLLFIGALYLGARMLRTRGDGLEAAVRLSVVVTAVVLVIGLFAQPEIEGARSPSSPLLAALGTLAISLVVACGVLQRDHLAAWLSQRPGARSAVRALERRSARSARWSRSAPWSVSSSSRRRTTWTARRCWARWRSCRTSASRCSG